MTGMRPSLASYAAALAAALAMPHRAAAQLPIPSLSLVGGISHYSLTGSGTAPFGAIRLDIPLIVLVAEGSVGVFRPREDAGTRTYVIPEAQLQWQIFPLLVKPYVGIGGGLFRAVSGPGEHTSQVTVSASAGVRVGLPLIGAGVRAEARVRGIGSRLDGRAAEYTVGVSW